MDSNADGDKKPAAPGLSDHLSGLASATRSWLTDSLGLILLDGQLAGVSLVRMLVYGLVAFIMFVTGWLALMLAMAFLLHRAGLAIELVILLVAILSIALGVFLVFRISALSDNITFKTTRQHFGKGGARREPDHMPDRMPDRRDGADRITAAPGPSPGSVPAESPGRHIGVSRASSAESAKP